MRWQWSYCNLALSHRNYSLITYHSYFACNYTEVYTQFYIHSKVLLSKVIAWHRTTHQQAIISNNNGSLAHQCVSMETICSYIIWLTHQCLSRKILCKHSTWVTHNWCCSRSVYRHIHALAGILSVNRTVILQSGTQYYPRWCPRGVERSGHTIVRWCLLYGGSVLGTGPLGLPP